MVCNCKGLLLATLVLCGWLGAIHPAQSADLGPQLREQLAEPAPPPSQWQFSFTPYGWMININGNVTARGHTVDVNENFFQIVEKSNSLMALMGYFEARKGPFAFFTDVVFADLGFPGHLQVQRDIVTRTRSHHWHQTKGTCSARLHLLDWCCNVQDREQLPSQALLNGSIQSWVDAFGMRSPLERNSLLKVTSVVSGPAVSFPGRW